MIRIYLFLLLGHAILCGQEDPIVERARQAAGAFAYALPNYICRQVTTRFSSSSHDTTWRKRDVVSAEVTYEKGQENYRNITVDGTPLLGGIDGLPGARSRGEFGTILRDLFSESTAAQFRFRKDTTVRSIPAAIYEYEVRPENSHWKLTVANISVTPAYEGAIWIEKESGRILRLERRTRDIPKDFPMDKVTGHVTYEYRRIGGQQRYLLPASSGTILCQRDTNYCNKNEMEFLNYRKYSSDASISFDK